MRVAATFQAGKFFPRLPPEIMFLDWCRFTCYARWKLVSLSYWAGLLWCDFWTCWHPYHSRNIFNSVIVLLVFVIYYLFQPNVHGILDCISLTCNVCICTLVVYVFCVSFMICIPQALAKLNATYTQRKGFLITLCARESRLQNSPSLVAVWLINHRKNACCNGCAHKETVKGFMGNHVLGVL